jgi:threonine dehydrogenase-like Zn-dependent dehydrogenase
LTEEEEEKKYKIRDEKLKEIETILKEHDIKIKIQGCGCCGSPVVSFKYAGVLIIDEEDEFRIDMFAEGDHKL